MARLRCAPAVEERLVADVSRGNVGIATRGMAAGLDAGDGGRDALADVLDAQRTAVARLRDDGKLGESVAERLETEIDIDAMAARGESGRLTGAGER
jgi:hypothetical protein